MITMRVLFVHYTIPITERCIAPMRVTYRFTFDRIIIRTTVSQSSTDIGIREISGGGGGGELSSVATKHGVSSACLFGLVIDGQRKKGRYYRIHLLTIRSFSLSPGYISRSRLSLCYDYESRG